MDDVSDDVNDDVNDEKDLMIINKSGLTIRIPVADLRVMGRATQGVRLIKMRESDEIASIASVDHEEDEPVVHLDENGEPIINLTEDNETPQVIENLGLDESTDSSATDKDIAE